MGTVRVALRDRVHMDGYAVQNRTDEESDSDMADDFDAIHCHVLHLSRTCTATAEPSFRRLWSSIRQHTAGAGKSFKKNRAGFTPSRTFIADE